MNNYSEISKELPGNLDEKSRNLLLKFIMLSKTLSKQQIEEIRMGLEENVDVSLYAKKDFSDRKMREIRLGLKNNVDVTHYLNPAFTWNQMRETPMYDVLQIK